MLDRLSLAKDYLDEKIKNISSNLREVELCKYSLRFQVEDPLPFNMDEVMKAYDECIVNAECKLGPWKTFLENKRPIIEAEIQLEKQRWWNNVPFGKV